MLDQQRTTIQIIGQGLRLYLQHFMFLSRPMLFPVLGTILGCILSVWLPVQYCEYLDEHFHIAERVESGYLIIIGLLITLAPGLYLIVKAFWRYIILMCSFNRVIYALCTEEKGITFGAANGFINNKKGVYIKVLMFFTLCWVGVCLLPALLTFLPVESFLKVCLQGGLFFLLAMILLILSVYWCLSFQVLAFEDLSAWKILERSFRLIEQNFMRAAVLIVVTGLMTTFIPLGVWQIINSFPSLIDIVKDSLVPFITYITVSITTVFPVQNLSVPFVGNLEEKLAVLTISLTVTNSITALMLPFGSCVFTLLYADILRSKEGKKIEI